MEEESQNNIHKTTRGIETLLGDPKKAIRRLSGPMVVAMLVQTLYNIVDGIWVAGLGSDELAAVGLFFPVFMIVLSLATGMSVGGSSAISRKIGAKDKVQADSAAIHTLFMGIIIAILITLLVYPYIREIFLSIGAKHSVVDLVVGYGKIIIGGTILLIFNNIASGILRGEGDTKRVMYAMGLGSILNMILDPIFIYSFHLGIDGAAWATVVSILITSTLVFSWLFIKRNTYVNFRFRSFKYNGKIVKEILRVGVPASLAQMSMAIAIFILNYLIVKVEGTDGVAVFTSAWRLIMVGLVPLLGIATGVTAVTGAAFGAKNPQKLATGYFYGIKIGVVIEAGIVALIFIFASQLAYLFSYSQNTAHISDSLTKTLRELVWFLPTVPLGMLTSSMFQGIGKGENSLAMTILRTLIFQLLFAYILGIIYNYGLTGVCWGVVVGTITASLIGILWGQWEIKKLKRKLILNHYQDNEIT